MVFEQLEKAGLHVRESKCEFMVSSVSYLGHQIDKNGLHPLHDKVQALVEAPSSQSVQDLKAYLWLLTYYCKFLPDVSTVLAPLHRLLWKESQWQWTAKEEKAFCKSKELLTSSKLLVHFDARLEKEGLACVFEVKRFHLYLFGPHFSLVTDHKPLLALFNEHRSTSPMSAWIKRWSLLLAAYKYTLVFCKTEAHSNAAASRLPLCTVPAQVVTPPELVLLMEHLADSPVTAGHIHDWTQRDPSLARVLQYVKQGWSEQDEPALRAFSSMKNELYVH